MSSNLPAEDVRGTRVAAGHDPTPTLVGLGSIVFAVVYACSDLMELGQGGFSQLQLALTYAAEAAIPLLVLGLYAVQRPRIGLLGLAGAVLYSYVYVYFASTVVFALEGRVIGWRDLNEQLAPWMTLHGAVMVVGGVCLGLATARAGVFPRWTGYALVVAVCLVAATASAPDLVRTLAALLRAAVFVTLGVATLRTTTPGAPADG